MSSVMEAPFPNTHLDSSHVHWCCAVTAMQHVFLHFLRVMFCGEAQRCKPLEYNSSFMDNFRLIVVLRFIYNWELILFIIEIS